MLIINTITASSATLPHRMGKEASNTQWGDLAFSGHKDSPHYKFLWLSGTMHRPHQRLILNSLGYVQISTHLCNVHLQFFGTLTLEESATTGSLLSFPDLTGGEKPVSLTV